MDLKPIFIEAVDIPDAWFQCLYNILDYGRKWTVQQGSYVGETRMQLDFVTILIKKPYTEPYDLMLPKIPEGCTIPPPVADGYVEQYIPYIMSDYIEPNESYTYGSRIVSQLEPIVRLLKETPNTNQAILQVGKPDDYKLEDPPCLRSICMQIIKDKLVFYPMFRSWDSWGGTPANLAGIAVLQKYIADEIGIENGSMIATSKGLHLYGYAEEVAKIRCMKE